jgi:ferredoxin-NADP reductase/DMSO/TMAO reductase YedYZ heme-binding membrane subunit
MSFSKPAGVLPSTHERPLVDGTLAKRFAIACGIVPATLLAYDAWRGQLGVNDVNFAIRTTGLLGLVFLTLTLVITPLRRLTGANWLIAARRNLGVIGFAYIAAHFVIFFAFDRALDVGSTLTEIVERVYLWFGTGALVIMIPLAITSTDGMVTRLGAKRWKRLHRLAYVAVLFGVIHYYLLVKADVTKPLVFSIVFGGLMLVRFIPEKKPSRRATSFWSGDLVVASITQETHDTKTFRFALPAGGKLPITHTAGQYLNITLPIDGKRVKRSYTISSPPTRSGYLEITVKRAADGYASHYLHDVVKEGDRLHVSAPAGKFVFAGHESDRVVLIGGGVGITPMMSVIRSLADRAWTGEIHLFYSVRTRSDVIFGDELARLAEKHSNVKLHITYSSEAGHITREMLENAIPGLRRGPILVCGPAPMMTAMRALLVGMGIPDSDVLEEAFVSPGSSGTDAPIESVGEGIKNVQFSRAKKSVELPGGLTVLEAAEDCGVTIPYECRSGICGQCKTKLVSGRVVMESQDALTTSDRANGVVLACQARPVGDVVVDA